jgi:hypothetical protein
VALELGQGVREPVDVNAATRAQLVGRFVQGGLRLEVAEQDGKLVLRAVA